MTKRKNNEVEVIEPVVETPVVDTAVEPQPEPEVELTKRQKFRAQTVRLLVDSNPKKKGTMSFDRFNDYFGLPTVDLLTIDQVLRTTSIRMDDIRHDSAHGFIQLGDAPVAGREMTAGDL